MKVRLILLIFCASLLVLSALSTVNAAGGTRQLLCLKKGQTVQFSKCNVGIPNHFCGKDLCKVCVDYNAQTKIYCPVELTKCNLLNPDACPTLIEDIEPTTPPNAFNITNLTISPSFPLAINRSVNLTPQYSQSFNITFDTNRYPCNITVYLQNSNGEFFGTTTAVIKNKFSIPFVYTLPTNLTDGIYTLNVTFREKNTALPVQSFGQITIGNGVPPTPQTPPVEETSAEPPRRSGGGGGGGGGSSSKPKNVTTTNKTNSSASFENLSSQTQSFEYQKNTTQSNYTMNQSLAGITGAAVGSSIFPTKYMVLIILVFVVAVLGATIYVNSKKKKIVDSPKKPSKK